MCASSDFVGAGQSSQVPLEAGTGLMSEPLQHYVPQYA